MIRTPAQSRPSPHAGPEPRPLRVLLVVESSGGGTGRHVCDLAEGLHARGCDVHVIYGTARADAMFRQRMERLPGVRRQAIAMRTTIHPSDAAVVWKIRRYARAHGPFDVIHGHSSKGGALARLAAFGTRAAAVYTLHGLIMMDPTLARGKRLVYQAIEKILSCRTARVIAVSPEEARAAVRVGLGRSRVVTVPNGIGPMELATRAEARRTCGVEADAVVIGFIGRLVTQKAPEVLIESFATVAAKMPRARLVMVGDGPLMGSLRELAYTCGVADRIVWLGERDARQVLAGFDVFALPSWKEGLPYVVIEAMAAGHPVVATTSAGVEILVEPGVNGHATKPGDVASLAAALIDVVASDARLAAFGQASRRRAARFTADRMVDATLDLYRHVLPARPAASPLRPYVGAAKPSTLDTSVARAGGAW